MAGETANRARISGETYFFRDHGQFDLLRLRLLPELIERRRDEKSLRIWSAGCSSGEEAYSLAMLVDLLLSEREQWENCILGSDIDPDALDRARRGRFREWSFRLISDGLKRRYFRQQGDQWVLDERIRRMVTFRADDLVGAPFPRGELRDMDLILCRNVFIYFTPEEVASVANKLAATLSEGGYLMTGHTELIGHPIPSLRSRLFPDSVVYFRPGAGAGAGQGPRPPSAPVTAPARSTAAPPPSTPAVEAPPQPPEAERLIATARQYADLGEYDRAERTCREALALDPLMAGGYFTLAQLAQLRADFPQAEALLDKALYLEPRYVAAWLERAALCERGEDMPRARALRRTALEIVRTVPADALIEPYETTAAELARWLAE